MSTARWGLTAAVARLALLTALCHAAEGATLTCLADADAETGRVRAAKRCVAALLREPWFCAVGAREGAPRSLASVHAAAAIRFLGGDIRGVVRTSVKIPFKQRPFPYGNGMAVSRDGALVYLAGSGPCTDEFRRAEVQAFRIADGARVYATSSDMKWCNARQLAVSPADDDLVFVVDWTSRCVQVLTPSLERRCSIGAGRLHEPLGVCANADVVCVSDKRHSRVLVFRRSDDALLRDFGREGAMRGLHNLCFMADLRHVALFANKRVHIFDSASGVHVRTVGAGLRAHDGIMLVTPQDEIVVAVKAYAGNRRLWNQTKICIYDALGSLLKTFVCATNCIDAFAQCDGKLLGYDSGRWADLGVRTTDKDAAVLLTHE
jgi:hypothetical protein